MKRKHRYPLTKKKDKKSSRKNVKIIKVQQKSIDEHKSISIFRKVLKIISKPHKRTHLMIALFASILGFILNSFDEMELFGIKVSVGVFLYLLLFYAIKFLMKQNDKLKIELSGDPNLSYASAIYFKRINRNLNFIPCFIASSYFVIISVILGFVKINFVGVYSLLALACVVFAAFIVFQQYIYILLLLNSIAAIQKTNENGYDKLMPDRTCWFLFLERISYVYRNRFIIVGSLFIILFTLFSPVNTIEIVFYDKFLSEQYLPLLFSWVIILVAIVLMIPASSIIRYVLLHKIYNNLTEQSINLYQKLYDMESRITVKKSEYLEIIYHIYDRKYKLSDSYAWIIPSLFSLINFASVIISMMADWKDIISST
ncbi:MAG: hypothetical protein LBM02_07210 [Lachnospiraceae bacterium]|jgi:hypothetical protein|nr:hypothetical protein [Lachnospiraceae bacterium]